MSTPFSKSSLAISACPFEARHVQRGSLHWKLSGLLEELPLICESGG